jgi:uncharacterized protein (TIGR02453 family)
MLSIVSEGVVPQSTFPGFHKDFQRFFQQLEQNNQKEWFDPRKAEYESIVRAPMLQLCELINRDLMDHAPEFILEPKKAVYRIYRDTRFSKDKTPYKTHVAAYWPHQGLRKTSHSGYYVALSHKSVELGGGCYAPEAPQLLQVRQYIQQNLSEWRSIVQAPALRKALGELQGDQLTRNPKGFAADDPASEFLRRKAYFLFVTLPPETALDAGLLREVTKRFRLMTPLVEFLNRPLLAATKRKQANNLF